jgi:nitrate reductase beta subunit
MTLKASKGEIMRKQYLRILITLIGAAGLAMAAKAQEIDQIVVNIPYEFVVAGKTLPAGTYRMNRVSNSIERALLLSSFENRASVIVVATDAKSISSDKAQVSFEQVGGQYFLSTIETAEHVFTIPVSHSAIMEAAAKSHRGTSASGSATGRD